jgi:hypothetical protein
MLAFLLSAAFRMLLLAGIIYATFFVPIGEHTLYRHATRIAATPEAQELGDSVVGVADKARQTLSARLAQTSDAPDEHN